MRLAFMTFACPGWSLDQVLDAAARHGYEGLEPRLDSGHAHGLEVGLGSGERVELRRRIEDSGTALCCLATSLQVIQPGPGGMGRLLVEAMARIVLAADLGAPALRVFGGPVPGDLPRDVALDRAADALRTLGEAAVQHGVELWVETHDTLSLGVDCAAVVAACDHPAVGINWDVMHPYRLGEPLESTLAALRGRIRHCHWHDALAQPGRPEITRFGEGELPLEAMIEALRVEGYTGYLSGEWFGEQLGATPDEALAHYAKATRALLASPR